MAAGVRQLHSAFKGVSLPTLIVHKGVCESFWGLEAMNRLNQGTDSIDA